MNKICIHLSFDWNLERYNRENFAFRSMYRRKCGRLGFPRGKFLQLRGRKVWKCLPPLPQSLPFPRALECRRAAALTNLEVPWRKSRPERNFPINSSPCEIRGNSPGIPRGGPRRLAAKRRKREGWRKGVRYCLRLPHYPQSSSTVIISRWYRVKKKLRPTLVSLSKW